MISGGFAWTLWHIVHLNVSLIMLINGRGIFTSFVMLMMSATLAFKSVILSAKASIFVPNCTLFLFGCSMKSLSSSEESITIAGALDL